MRQRYYNPEIKRFVNQDILTGSIGNSQSLNRYSYVQGNPVSYTDPFGLSPLNGTNPGSMIAHTVLGLVGWVPGWVGAIANGIDAVVYAVVDKDYKNALFAGGSAVTFGVGKIVSGVGKGSKAALNVQRVCNFAGSGINFAQSAEGTYQTASMMADKYIVQGQPFSGSTVLEVGLLAANIFGTYKSGTNTLNDLADFGGSAIRSFKAWRNGNAGQSSDGLLNEGTFTRYLADGRQVTDVTNLPGSTGIKSSRRLTTDEMTFLTQEYGVEFAQVYHRGAGKNGGGGYYMLYSGNHNSVSISQSMGPDAILINHTHPRGTSQPSNQDIALLQRLQSIGSPQKVSEIIPIGKQSTVFFDVNGVKR